MMSAETQYTAIVSFTAHEEKLPEILEKLNATIQENTVNGVKITIISPAETE